MNETEFGPEYLETYADRMASNSDELGARPFRQMSKAWNEDRKALQDAHDENTRMQARLAKAALALGEAA